MSNRDKNKKRGGGYIYRIGFSKKVRKKKTKNERVLSNTWVKVTLTLGH